MFWSRRNLFRRPLLRRLCSGLALVAYLAAAVGFPLPAAARKEQTQPFPCQDHPCGCRTAEDCWRHCCCYSPEQRLAWARAHHVQPPDYAEKPSGTGWQTVRLRDRDKAPVKACGACCSLPRCQKTHSPAGSRSCCQTACHHSLTFQPAAAVPAKKAAPASRAGLRWALGWNAPDCQGLSTMWISSGAAVPPPALLTWSPCETSLGWLADGGTTAVATTFAPPVPPPRVPVI
jgi:hypothetical protein